MTETALDGVLRRIREEIARDPIKRSPFSEYVMPEITTEEYEEQMARYRRNGEIGYRDGRGVWIPAIL